MRYDKIQKKFIMPTITFTTAVYKFGNMGEKTGWTYIEIEEPLAQQLNPGIKTSYRVKGTLNQTTFKSVALVPMGEGNYIMALNADMRKISQIKEGDTIQVTLELDNDPILLDQDLIDCLAENEVAFTYFKSLPFSHQHYYSKWIASAKTFDTKAKRIAKAYKALSRKMSYSDMIREKDN